MGDSASDLVTATITEQNTWTAAYICPGDPREMGFVPIIARITGAAIVTVQVRRRSGGVWDDYANTTGTVNAGSKLHPIGAVAVPGGWELRAGVKTGELNGGSAVIEVGTLG